MITTEFENGRSALVLSERKPKLFLHWRKKGRKTVGLSSPNCVCVCVWTVCQECITELLSKFQRRWKSCCVSFFFRFIIKSIHINNAFLFFLFFFFFWGWGGWCLLLVKEKSQSGSTDQCNILLSGNITDCLAFFIQLFLSRQAFCAVFLRTTLHRMRDKVGDIFNNNQTQRERERERERERRKTQDARHFIE